jgi:riboflavin kinase/FMN adenylyltransferase
MRVIPLHDAQPRARRVAVGTFDGVHLGHREVIAGSDTVLTFDPHPLSIVAPAAAPKLLTTLERKAELVAELGVDDVLVRTLGAEHVSVGENFRFGHRAQGDTELLRADDRFTTSVVPLLEVDGEVVSSSHIRGLVLAGEVEEADRLLGAPFVMDGPVVPGDRRGRTLGFPTANLVPVDGYVLPGHGVYACRARTADGTWHVAAVNVGVRPQFVTGRGELVEAFLVDFSGDLYGSSLRIEFLRRLRGERRFESVDALVAQMGRDVDEARAVAGS